MRNQRGRRFWLFLAATATVAICLPTIRASATAGVTGGGAFTGTLTLPTFPCPFSVCGGGSLVGLFTGTMSGVDPASCPMPPPIPTPPGCRYYSVTWPDPTSSVPASNLNADFSYSESCPVAETAGATGTFTISGGLVDDNGVTAHDGAATGGFGYSRYGLAFTVLLGPISVSGNGHALGSQQAPLGAGGGAFAPLDVGTCNTVHAINAQVAGVVLNPA